ncbi:MAG: caspase family protein [Deltaproteobacteria bacterium]|nr:MAG: caspase family protein [Deltaproteobacteria bacterium]
MTVHGGDQATRRIGAFAARFGDTYVDFACHAAFPVALTPDLGYVLWLFLQRGVAQPLAVPWIVVADVLLSSLCAEVAPGLYEIDPETRVALLDRLERRFGRQRIEDLSQLLHTYVEQRMNQDTSRDRRLAQAQRWTAMAPVAGEEMVREITATIDAAIETRDPGEALYMRRVVEAIGQSHPEVMAPVLAYAMQIEQRAAAQPVGRPDSPPAARPVGGHALVVGAVAASGRNLRAVDHDVRDMTRMFVARGFEVDVRTGNRATRQGILDGYDALIHRVRPGDAAVFYYTGHAFRAFVEAWELSILEARLTRRTRNVTVILDCGHASQMSRSGPAHAPLDDALTPQPHEMEHPAAIGDAVPRALPHPLRLGFAAHLRALRARYGAAFDAVDPAGNPDVVRLAACGPDQSSFEYIGGDGEYHGVFTEALLQVLSEVGDTPVSWAALESAIRWRVQHRFSIQRPDIEGPARRRLFSLEEDELGGAVAIASVAGRFRLDAGRLMGVVAGDIYGVMPPGFPSYRADKAVADVQVAESFATFATAALLGWRNGHSELPRNAIGIAIEKATVRRPVQVVVPAPERQVITAEIEATSTLRVAEADDPTMLAWLRMVDGMLVIEDQVGPLAAAARYPQELSHTVRHLANLAAAQGLRELEGEHGVDAQDLDIEWGTIDGSQMQPLPQRGGALTLRDRIYVRVKNREERTLHAHIFSIGVRGKITLLTAFAPSGVALTVRDPELVLGRRSDGALLGLGLGWPRDMPRRFPRIAEVVVIVTSRAASLRVLETEELVVSRNVGEPRDLDGYFMKRLSCLLHPPEAATAPVSFVIEDAPQRQEPARDFVPDIADNERPSGPRALPATDQDFGLVIGIDDYPYFRPLRGAAADATRFHSWLCAADGGGVPSHHARLILSDPRRHAPSQVQIDESLVELLQAAEALGGGRRLYVYFSGHGGISLEESDHDIALLLARWSRDLPGLALSTERYSRSLSATGLFDEVVMFIDCCRDSVMSVTGVAPTFRVVPKTPRRSTRMFRAFAAEAGRPAFEFPNADAWQGLFTRCLLSILEHSSGLGADALKDFLERQLENEARALGVFQRAYVENGLHAESCFGQSGKLPALELRSSIDEDS